MPLVVVTVIGVVVLVPHSRDADAPALDLLGTVLSTIGLVALLYGVIEGPHRGWGSATIVGSFTTAVDPELGDALHARLVKPRQAELTARLERALARGETKILTSIPVACTQLVGPIYFRALVSTDPIDDELLRSVVDGVLVAAEV